MAAIPYTLAQGDVKTLSNPARIVAVGGDNGTGFYLYFPNMPPGQQWVAPKTFGFMYLIDSPRIGIGPVVDTTQTPPWGTVPAPGQTTTATITAYDTDQLFDAGVTSPGSVDIVDRSSRLLGIIDHIVQTVTVDVTDRAARLLGVVDHIAQAVDISDRVGRLLGVIDHITQAVDISDRMARLLGAVNVQQANGIPVLGPNLVPLAMRGPIVGGWGVGANLTIVFNAGGTMQVTAVAAGDASVLAPANISDPFSMIPVTPGETYQIGAAFETLDHPNTVAVALDTCDAQGNVLAFAVIASATPAVLTWININGTYLVPPGVYFLRLALFSQAFGTGAANDRCLIDRVFVQKIGVFPTTEADRAAQFVTHANQPIATVRTSINSGSSATVIANPSVGSIFLWGIRLSMDALTLQSIQLSDNNGNIIEGGPSVIDTSMEFDGARTPQGGFGVKVINASGAARFIACSVAYANN